VSLLLALLAILASLFGSPGAAPTTSEPAAIGDGRHFASLLSGTTGGEDGAVLDVDVANFLTGADAAAACERLGEPECPPPNDYLIEDDGAGLVRLPIDANATIDLVDWANCCEARVAGNTADLVAALTTLSDGSIYRAGSRYWLTVTGGRITAVEEQYLP
jgi:hypothetical protein